MTNQAPTEQRRIAKVAEPAATPSMNNIWSDPNAFQTAQRMANALSASTIVPKDYQGERGLGNCMIALEMANRLKTSPLMVMQNLYIVNGRPAWSSQYIIAMINNSKKYKTEIQFEIEGTGEKMSCTAFVEDYSNRIVKGPTITMEMAKAEGWVTKNGSKWKTMPEVMIRYRAASFFGRLNCPDMIMGLYSVEEATEIEADFVVIDQEKVIEEEIKEYANTEILDPKTKEQDTEKNETEENIKHSENVAEHEEIKEEQSVNSDAKQQTIDATEEDDPF